MKFQNISIHGSKVMLCTKKHDKRTNENKERTNLTNERMNRQAGSNMPPNFFQSWGHKNRSNFGEVDVAPAPPHPHPPEIKKKCLFQVEEINIGISLKAYAFSHMMHEKLGSKSTHSTFIKSEAKK